MIIDLKTHKDGAWFSFFYSHIDPSTLEIIYDDPIEGGPKMKIRDPMPFFDALSDERKTKKEFVLNKKSRGMELVESEIKLTPKQKKAENENFADYVICEIENFKLDGQIIKCTRENKIKIMTIPLVAMFVHRCIEILRESGAQIEKEEAESKNLPTGSSSATTKPDPE